MPRSSVSPYGIIRHLTFNHVEVNLQTLFLKSGLSNRMDRLQDFARQQKIAPEILAYDGRLSSFPNFAEVALDDNRHFSFQRELTGPAVTHQALVYIVRGTYREVIDLVAIVPTLNQAALYLGTRGVLGFHRFSHRGARRGVRVYRDPMQYLRDGRNGILIVDPVKAALELRGKLLVVESTEHAHELAQLGLDTPPVIIRPLWRRR